MSPGHFTFIRHNDFANRLLYALQVLILCWSTSSWAKTLVLHLDFFIISNRIEVSLLPCYNYSAKCQNREFYSPSPSPPSIQVYEKLMTLWNHFPALRKRLWLCRSRTARSFHQVILSTIWGDSDQIISFDNNSLKGWVSKKQFLDLCIAQPSLRSVENKII